MNDQTSLITILSSDHGRLRREQRDIRKRDLQKALKHGTCEASWGGRCRIEYDGVVFITDGTRRREITAFPAPISLAPVDEKTYQDHLKARQVISKKPELCASHTVLVVDTSGSMKTHDILLHRDRQVAAYTTMALEYVAEQLFKETANNRDVVSLVEFNSGANIVFEREPISWVLFNKLLNRRGIGTGYKVREGSRVSDAIFCDSNYLPAFDSAEKLLEMDLHEDVALSLFFISDGKPTDAAAQGLTPQGALREMERRVAKIASRFVDQINISLVGFGNSYLDFSSLESIVKASNEAAGAEIANFVYCDKLAHSVGSAVSSLASSTLLTKTALMTGGRLTSKNKRSDIALESETGTNEWQYFKIIDHFVYDPRVDNWVPFFGLPPGCCREENIVEVKERQKRNRLPPLLAMNKDYFGVGAERVAFRCHLADMADQSSFRLGAMVAKETLRADRVEELISFHKSFCETQSLAAHLADQFNKKLCGLPHYSREKTPQVNFLKCSVLILADEAWPMGERGVLVEKQLDTSRYAWRKWNDNCGGVDGKVFHRPIDVDYELAQLELELNDAIVECSDEEESDEDTDIEEHGVEGIDDVYQEELQLGNSGDDFSPSDYLQAFSHFSYLFTNKKVLVCDLQGIYNPETIPPRFELSDPAIHYRSSKGSPKRLVYGRTDRGQGGVQQFFNSHKCTGICKILQLSQKNQKWKQDWHRNFAEDMHNNFGF